MTHHGRGTPPGGGDEASAGRDAGASWSLFEPPDLCVGVFIGDISEAEMRRMLTNQRRMAEGKEYILVLTDLSRMTGLSAGARRCAAQGSIDSPVRGIASFGVKPTLRVISSVVFKAINLLRGSNSAPFAFVATEAEARAWIEARRREILAATKGGGGAPRPPGRGAPPE